MSQKGCGCAEGVVGGWRRLDEVFEDGSRKQEVGTWVGGRQKRKEGLACFFS